MNKYLLKTSFKSKDSLEKIKNKILKLGVSEDHIDSFLVNNHKKEQVSSFSENTQNGLVVKRLNRSFSLGGKYFFAGGTLFGGAYLLMVLMDSQTSFSSFIFRINYLNLFSMISYGSFIGFLSGFFLGKDSIYHGVFYEGSLEPPNFARGFKSQRSRDGRIPDMRHILAVNLNSQLLEKVKAILKAENIDDYAVLDMKKEIELGIRKQ